MDGAYIVLFAAVYLLARFFLIGLFPNFFFKNIGAETLFVIDGIIGLFLLMFSFTLYWNYRVNDFPPSHVIIFLGICLVLAPTIATCARKLLNSDIKNKDNLKENKEQ